MTSDWRVRCAISLAIPLAFVCGASSPAWCQSMRVEDELNSMFKGKTLLLRNFYAGKDLDYDENGVARGDVAQGSWTLANVEITQIAVAPQGIEIIGNRIGTWYKDGKIGSVKIGRLKIHVTKHIADADTEKKLHPIFAKIFVEAGEDLRPMVPEYWRYYLEGGDSKARFAAWRSTLEKDATPAPPAADITVGKSTAPRVISQPDPKYSKEAASHHIEGVSRLGVVIGTTGTASNIAILEPLGMGLDEQAVLAIERWKFQPGMKDGQPVRVPIDIEIAFKCCL